MRMAAHLRHFSDLNDALIALSVHHYNGILCEFPSAAVSNAALACLVG
jgi:hypothetical protein